MNVHIKIFPIAGLCDETRKLELTLEEGSMNELLTNLREQFNVNPKIEELMFLHNGRALNRRKNTVFRNGDELWLLPMLSGG